MKCFNAEFCSSIKEVTVVSENADAFFRCKCSLKSEEQLFNLKLCLRELLINAIEHGNRMNADKKVMCRIIVDDREIKIYVLDEGEGFSLSQYYERDDLDDVMRERGRGLQIIEKLGFHIEVDNNTVMVKCYVDEIN